jgi:DNA-binding response OmpR family regulator
VNVVLRYADIVLDVVATSVSYLRRTLAVAGPPLITTVRRAGYVLDGPDG